MEVIAQAHVSDANGMSIAWGENDPIIPVRHGREAFKGSTGVTLTTYPESRHFPHLAVPFDFARDLRAFICDPPPRTHTTRSRVAGAAGPGWSCMSRAAEPRGQAVVAGARATAGIDARESQV